MRRTVNPSLSLPSEAHRSPAASCVMFENDDAGETISGQSVRRAIGASHELNGPMAQVRTPFTDRSAHASRFVFVWHTLTVERAPPDLAARFRERTFRMNMTSTTPFWSDRIRLAGIHGCAGRAAGLANFNRPCDSGAPPRRCRSFLS